MPSAAVNPRDADLRLFSEVEGRDAVAPVDGVTIIATERAELALLDLARALGRRAARRDFTGAQAGPLQKADRGAVARS